MMVPRSYPFLHSPSSSSPSPPPKNEKMGGRSQRPLPTPLAKSSTLNPTVKSKGNMQIPTSAPTTSPEPTHSAPVVIPPRAPMRTATSSQTIRARGQHGGRPQRVPKNHKPDAIPPAVAALLAVTAIPRMPARRRTATSMERSISMDELIKEWNEDHAESPSSVVGSPMDLLLGRVEESEDEYGSLQSVEQDQDAMTTRSISSESLSTIPPSLDLDAPSFTSTWDNLSTPESYGGRREKMVQSPPKEDCVLDHPLLHFSPDDSEELSSLEISDMISSTPPSSDRFKSFKSNLTASLQALKSAAKSFSNFTAPSVPPDDLLTRSLLSPRFTSEMRPKQLPGLPSPALRRYMNPQSNPISPSELSMQLHDSLVLDDMDHLSAPMIQMQTYDRRSRSSSRRRRGSDPYSEAGRAASPTPTVRQREPRENSDFLRVIVLEMNMRRVGKLDAKAVGKARIWLPPRKLGSGKPPSQTSASRVPDRWLATVVAEL